MSGEVAVGHVERFTKICERDFRGCGEHGHDTHSTFFVNNPVEIL